MKQIFTSCIMVSVRGNRISPICVCLGVWVCESYIVHHLNGTGLRCAPPTYVVLNIKH